MFNPFPEELSRRMIDRMADYLFTSSEESYNNVIKQGVKGEIVNMGYNTVIDAIRFAITNPHKVTFRPEPGYVLVNVHRVENLYSKERLDIIISTIEKIAEHDRVLLIMHEPLKNKLQKVNMLDRLKGHEKLRMIPLQDYVTNIDLIKNSKYIVNDGGAPQLESYFLSRPCLLMRGFMEQNGYPNVCLSRYETSIIDDFLKNYSNYVFDVDINALKSPSKEIVDILTEKMTRLKNS
jgi:UDP-N-acetylglucosamine 2-epimerase (non-hydrolysing)